MELVALPGAAEVPGLDDPALRGIDIFLVLHVPDADTHAVLCEDNVLLSHALRGGVAELGGGNVDLVKNPADSRDYDEGRRREARVGGWLMSREPLL